MKIFAHRGIWDLYPENSRSAILGALNRGFSVELDIRFTTDGKVLIMHDKDLARLCGINKCIGDLSSADILNISFLSRLDERPVFFDDLASCITQGKRDARVAIHFKQNDQRYENCVTIANLFCKYDLYDSCFLFNLSLDTCHRFRELDPKIDLSVLVSDYKFEPFIYFWDEVRPHNDLFDFVWAAEFRDLYKEEFFREVYKLDKKVIVVSPELHRGLGHPKAFEGYQECWSQFLSNAVSGVCTDFPFELSQFLSDRKVECQERKS